MPQVEIHGTCPDRFAAVKDCFAANFADGGELGAGFAVAVEGEVVVELWGGFTDRRAETPWARDTLAPVFSCTKAISSIVIAAAVGEGLLRYDQKVTELWPEFGQAGKGELTVEQVLSHQAGLSGFLEPMDPALWFDWDALCAHLAETTPLWPPGTASGYHPVTWGYLAGEIYRRATGRTIGAALREDFCAPLGLDMWIGLPDSEHARVTQMVKPSGAAQLSNITPIRRAAFLQAWSSPGGRGTSDWRRMEIPSANGHGTAPSLARMMASLACDGEVGGRRVLPSGAAAEASRPRICGQDLVLPFEVCWGAGVLRNDPIRSYGPGMNTVGHSGWGGSTVIADPDRRLSSAYVLNKQSTYLVADPRSLRLIAALYESL
jgi:CubicO group peptidase (beta-lactamase class C family)